MTSRKPTTIGCLFTSSPNKRFSGLRDDNYDWIIASLGSSNRHTKTVRSRTFGGEWVWSMQCPKYAISEISSIPRTYITDFRFDKKASVWLQTKGEARAERRRRSNDAPSRRCSNDAPSRRCSNGAPSRRRRSSQWKTNSSHDKSKTDWLNGATD